MTISTIVTGAVIDMAKKYLFEAGKKTAHEFVDSVSGKKMGQLICYRKEEGYNNVLLFVHGFSGSAADTFGATPDLLLNEPSFAGWDVYSIGYSSDIFPAIGKGLWSVNPDISKIALYLNTLIKNQFSDYSRIAFVAHSMGGLAVERSILDLENPEKGKISHVILFGAPSAGLKKAYWFEFWNLQVRDLSCESVFVKKLRKDWAERFKDGFPFSFKTIAGSKDDFVPVESSLFPFDKKYHGVIEGNHITMIKPINGDDKQHQSFGVILSSLTNQNIDLKGNPEEINLLLGEYQSIINKYLHVATRIGLKQLAMLVFALECNDRKAEAIQVLTNHPGANNDSDTLGIIGGRHKRKYLLEGLQSDLNNAFQYYQKALTISVAKPDKKQIFYHAINLAFLSIVANRDYASMKAYAQQALDNCNNATIDMWEKATLAEANLYLGDLEQSAKFYKEAAQLAGTDIRAKQSMYSNAFYGYQALTASENREADFLKMLEETLL